MASSAWGAGGFKVPRPDFGGYSSDERWRGPPQSGECPGASSCLPPRPTRWEQYLPWAKKILPQDRDAASEEGSPRESACEKGAAGASIPDRGTSATVRILIVGGRSGNGRTASGSSGDGAPRRGRRPTGRPRIGGGNETARLGRRPPGSSPTALRSSRVVTVRREKSLVIGRAVTTLPGPASTVRRGTAG
ncbi:MAG: hypothetical protein DRQ42_07740 [Gammaproteobacteria bacterium]|nr:MAG: hypothetical protein DRQ42_07740 [Gammaproteobacteria bacterium]